MANLDSIIRDRHDSELAINPSLTKWPCPFCPQLLQNARGVKLHITKKHQAEHRAFLVDCFDTHYDSNEPPEDASVPSLSVELESIIEKLNKLLHTKAQDHEKFESIFSDYQTTLRKCDHELPGPSNPSSKFYKMRKNEDTFQNADRNYQQGSNPDRRSKRDRQARKQKFKKKKIQWLYSNNRKKAVVLATGGGDNKGCTIDLNKLHEEFSQRWSSPNHKIRISSPAPSLSEQEEIDAGFSSTIPAGTMKHHIKKLNRESSPGPDGIIPRWVKATTTHSAIILSLSLQYMLDFNYVPAFMKEARTVLIFKNKGDPSDTSSWRPISICSVLRRILEKAIDQEFRSFVSFSDCQRGFTSVDGTLINTKLFDACMKKAKKDKSDFTGVFLDLVQAFDNLGHEHIKQRINSKTAPSKLKQLTISLQIDNRTTIQTNKGKTKPITFKRGVLQGSPLSPFVFNIAIDEELEELNDPDVRRKYGFNLHPNHENETVSNYADDTGLKGNSRDSAKILAQMAIHLFEQLGLPISNEKSEAISIVKGALCTEDLIISENLKIKCLKEDERVKYLGVNFKDELTFDQVGVIKKFRSKLENLVATPFLRPDQKLYAVNQYIWPMLIFPFQHAPLKKLTVSFLSSVDLILRSAVKEILGVPDCLPTSMMYSSHNVKGLNLVQASWEASIQQFNASDILLKCGNEVLNTIFNFEKEKTDCLEKLKVPLEIRKVLEPAQEESENRDKDKPRPKRKSKVIREYLRNVEYQKWCALPSKGKGVIQFQQNKAGNKWVLNKNGLSSSEWVTAIKMNGNVLPVNANPGHGQESNRCRYCNEIESLGHILGKCTKGELLRNNRHHTVRSIIASHFSKMGWKVFEEVSCRSSGDANAGTPRRVDIIAIEPHSRNALILDPTIRIETDENQAILVNEEKKSIYDPCIPYFQNHFNLSTVTTIGLYFGARGTISKFFDNFLSEYRIPKSIIEDIVIAILKGSSQICQQHLYSTPQHST